MWISTSRFAFFPRVLRGVAFAFALGALLPEAVAQVTPEIVLYEFENFGGRSFVTNETIPTYSPGWNNRASSAIVRIGSWQVCTDVYFRGRCETLPPGQYPTLRSMRLDNTIASARDVGWQGGTAPGGPAPGRPGAPGPRATVELYESNGFGGRTLSINDAENNFSREFNDRASSMIVHNGYWEACEDINYHGRCQVYGPGRYPNLGPMANRISSIRPVAAPAQPSGPAGGPWGSGARALLYEHPNFGGRTFVLTNEVATNFAASGFNDRASSLRIEGGYWMFCSDANFLGECLTFGPGDYAQLPAALNNRVSSGRRIRENYPYSQTPNWQR